MPNGRLAAVCAAALLLAGCATEDSLTPQPRDGRAGLQLSGTVDGAQVAVSDGSPDLVVGDCDVVGGPAEDLCVVTRDLRGEPVTLAVRNPGVLEAGEAVTVADAGCRGRACDEVTDEAVVDVVIGETRHRAQGGTLGLTRVDEGRRYVGRLRVELDAGVLSGHFDLVPRPD